VCVTPDHELSSVLQLTPSMRTSCVQPLPLPTPPSPSSPAWPRPPAPAPDSCQLPHHARWGEVVLGFKDSPLPPVRLPSSVRAVDIALPLLSARPADASSGTLADVDVLKEACRINVGDITFQVV
jgi:hypothetical protein